MRILGGILLGSMLLSTGPVLAEDDASELRALKARLRQLEQKMEVQARKEEALAARQSAMQDTRMAAKAPVPFDPCASGKLCYKGVTFTFGGWVDLTGIYRTRNLASDTGSVYAFIPFPQSKNFNTGESRFSARQTRFSVLAEAEVFANTRVAGYGELDLEGAAQTANSVATNSFNPRLRQASVEISRSDLGLHVLAGQSWSLNAPSKAGIDPRGVDAPGVIDFESVPGFLAARQPGIRVWQDIGPEFKLAVSAENPQTSFFGGNAPLVGTPAVGPQGVLNPNLLVNLTGPGGSFFNNANNVSLNHVPDFTVKGAWDPRLGAYKLHVEGWAMYRDFYDRFNFANHDVSTVSFGGHFSAEIVPKLLELQGLRVARRARPLHRGAVPGRHGAPGRHDPAAADHRIPARHGLAHDAVARSLRLCRPREDQADVLQCRHGAVRLRQSALQQSRLQHRELAGRDLQRQHLGGQAIHRRLL